LLNHLRYNIRRSWEVTMPSDPLVRHSSTLRYPEWQRPYQAALLELDPKKLAKHMEEAEAAIFKRLQQLSQSQGGQVEREVIEGAISALKILKRDSLNLPDWESGLRGGS
jgi:hypothetical protein